MTEFRKRNNSSRLLKGSKISTWNRAERVIWFSSWQCCLMKQPLTILLWKEWPHLGPILLLIAAVAALLLTSRKNMVNPQESMHRWPGKACRAQHALILLLNDVHYKTSKLARFLCDSSIWASFFICPLLGKIKDLGENLRSRRNYSDMKTAA